MVKQLVTLRPLHVGGWVCGPQQPTSVHELVLTPGSILEVTTMDIAGMVDGTALLVVETTCSQTCEVYIARSALAELPRLLGCGSGLAYSRASTPKCQPWPILCTPARLHCLASFRGQSELHADTFQQPAQKSIVEPWPPSET